MSFSRLMLTVFAVNSRRDPVEVRLDLSAFGAGANIAAGEVVADTQDRRQIDVTNGWDHPDRVRTLPLQFQGRRCALPALSVAAMEIR